MKKFAIATLSALFVMLGAGQARAQACGDVGEVPSEYLDMYIETFEQLFPLAASECDKIAKGAVSACHKAVSASASCSQNELSGLRKGAKTACKAQGTDEDACNATVGGVVDLVQGLLEAEADGAHLECDGSFASLLENTCRGAL